MAVFTIPPSVPYVGGYVAFGNGSPECPPVDGYRSAPFYIDWVNQIAQSAPTIAIDFTNYSNMPSRITSVFVDNGRNHQGVALLFPDTSFRLIVPAFKRGFYPVLTASQRFFCSIGNVAQATNDHTVIHTLNYPVMPIEGDALINAAATAAGTSGFSFDPSVSSAARATIFGSATSVWNRIREMKVYLSGITAGLAGFQAMMTVFASPDGVAFNIISNAGLHLAANEFVDANTLISLGSADIPCVLLAYTWSVIAGSCTTDGVASGNFNVYRDIAEAN